MFCGIDFMAIWFYLKESVLILLVSILTSTFSTDFSKVLTKVKFDPENSPALNEFLEQLLIKHENLEWVDKLTQTFKGIGSSNSGLEIRKNILKRNDHRYRNRRKLRPYYTNSRNFKTKNSNLEGISHLNIEDYENAISGVLKKNGYKQQRVKQKRNIVETPLPTTNYENHTVFDLLDSSTIDPRKKDKIDNYQTLYNKQKEVANIIKKSAKERSINYDLSTTVYVKPEELEELMKVVEPVAKNDSNEKNREKNKTLGIMNSKKTELTITKSSDIRQKNDISSKNELETTLSPLIVIVMESAPTEKTLKKKSITTTVTTNAKPADMIPRKAKIKTHFEKNIFFDNPNIEQQIDASPTNANVKSINLDNINIMTDPYVFRFTETTEFNLMQPSNLEKRQNIIEVDPAKVMSPQEIRRAKIEAKKLLDVDKDFNERNEPDFNKELMTSKNYDYKDIDDYLDLKDKNNQKHKNNRIQSEGNILKSEEKQEIKSNEMQQNSFFSRQLLNYDYDDNYQNKLYSDYDDYENSLRRYPREVNQNYLFPNEGDDYFDHQNDESLEKRFYKKRWKKDTNGKNSETGLFNKKELKKKINKLKNFFGIGHENNYNENVEDDYPVANMAIDDYIAKNKELIEDNILKTLSEKPEDIIQNINDSHDTEYVENKKSFHQQNNVNQNTLSSLARKTFQTKADNNFNLPGLKNEREETNNNLPELNSKIKSLNSLQQTTIKGIQENTQTKQNTKPNSIQSSSLNNLAINSIIETKFPNTFKSNTETTNLYDFNTKQPDTSTTTLNPLSYSFDYKINLFDGSSSSSEKIVNLKGKRESHAIKNLLANYKTKHAGTKPKESTTATLFVKDITKYSEDGKIYKNKSFSLINNKKKKKLIDKYKLRNFPKYHSNLKEMLNYLSSQTPSAEVHLDELKLNAIKQNQKKNKKTQARESLPDCRTVKTYDLDDEDYIPSDYENSKSSDTVAFDGEELEHSDLLVKHSAEKTKDSNNCKTKKFKAQKHRYSKTKEKEAMKIAAHKKTKDTSNRINYAHGHVSSEDNENEQYDVNSLKTASKEMISCSDTTKDLTSNCTTTSTECSSKKTSSKKKKTTTSRTSTTTCTTKSKTTTCKSTSLPTTCNATSWSTSPTTCQTTCNKTTSPTTCKTTSPTTTCPTTSTCKTTCPTTSTCKTTSPTTSTCKTTCTTTSPTTSTCKTTCPTTSTCTKTIFPTTTTLPTTKTTTCKTTTCPTKTTTCPTKTTTTTCKTTTYPTKTTSCKTTTCPTTAYTATKICPATIKTTPYQSTTNSCPSCETSCAHLHSTHKFGVIFYPGDKNKNFIDRPKRKLIYNSQYFDNKFHKAKFNPYRVSRHVVFPKKKKLYNDIPKNEYQEMKHKNFIRRLKRKYFQNNNFAETNENNLIRRKKSINVDKDVNRLIDMPVYKVYPRMIKNRRYKRKKVKTDDDAEDAKQRKVLETIYHHRVSRRKNEPEFVSKAQSYDYTENNVDLPSSYNSEVKRNLIRRTTMDNSNNANSKETTASDSRSDAVIGKIPAKVVQDLYLDLSNSKDIKKNLGKILRSPQHDPKNPFPNLIKCEKECKEHSEKQLQQIIADVMNKLNSVVKVKVITDNCNKLDKDTQLFLNIITAHIKDTSGFENDDLDEPSQNMNLFAGNTLNSSGDMNKAEAVCKTIIVSPEVGGTKISSIEPCKCESTPNHCRKAKSSPAKAKVKSSTTKTTKISTTKSTKTTIKATKTTVTSHSKAASTTTEKIKGKVWPKPTNLKIEVFKDDKNKTYSKYESFTDEPVDDHAQNRKKFGLNHDTMMKFERPKVLTPYLNDHKVMKFNDQTSINKLPITHREVTNLIAMYGKLPEAEKRRNKYIYNYLHTQKLFLERMMLGIKNYYRQQRKRILRRKQNFHQSQHHVVWVPSESSDSSENTNYIKLKKRMIGDDQRDYFKNRIKRENYFRDVMRARRNPTPFHSKLDEWMKVEDEGYKPLYINFTF